MATDVLQRPIFDDTFVSYEYHSQLPYVSNTFNNNDEIRIPINQQDVFTHPSESYLLVEGKLLESNSKVGENYQLVNTAIAFFFEEVRFEINGIEIDRSKHVGVTSTLKNYLTLNSNNWGLLNAVWDANEGRVPVATDGSFSFCYPLKYLLPFCDEYDKPLLNIKSELVLLRSPNDTNAVVLPFGKTDYSLTLTKIVWKVPYVRVNAPTHLSLMKTVEQDKNIQIASRKWETHYLPLVPQSNSLLWTVKTSSHAETPRYVIVAFQKINPTNASHFLNVNVNNIKLYLNSVYFPYDNIQGRKSIFYDMYSRFKTSYNCEFTDGPILTPQLLNEKVGPFYVIDCSRQLETLKTGGVDIRLEIETFNNIPASVSAYCLIVFDSVMEYKPLSGIVRKIV